MEGRPQGLFIKAPNKTQKERNILKSIRNMKENEKHTKHVQTLKNIREGTYGKTYVGENMKYHLYNNDNNNNLNNKNLENIKYINNENTLFNNNMYTTPKSQFYSSKYTPPKLNKTLKRKINNMNTYIKNTNNNIPYIKRLKLQNQVAGQSRKIKRRVQRKTSRRYN